MSKHYSRKNFIRLTAMAGTGILIAGCSSKETKKAEVKVAPSDTVKSDTVTPTPEAPDKLSVDLVFKEDPRYEDLRKGFNKRINKYPSVIALCKSTQDVSEAIQYARKNNLAIAVKSGGHSMEGFSSNDDGMVINLRLMNSVKLLADDTVQAGPGCTLSNLYDVVLPQNRIIPAGSCGTVGLGGLTMGGGYGLFSRKFGLTCDHLLEATMVDGNGTIHSTKDDPELLWALRGGGAGNFGVVTEMIFKTQEKPETMESHHFKSRKLDVAKAKNLLQKWFEFSSQLPDTCFSAFVLNGSTLNILVTNFGALTPELQTLLDTLALETDEFKNGPRTKIERKLKNYYGSLVPVYFKNSSAGLYNSFNELEPFIENVFNKIIGNTDMIFQINTLGGKVADAELSEGSCYPHRAFNYISELQAYWKDPSQEEKFTQASTEILKLISDNGIAAQYINYCSLEFNNWETAYYGGNYSRLQAVKKKYDPDNFIRHPQSVKV